MQNKRAASNLNLSSNLCEQAVHLIEFLQGVYDKPELQQPSVLKRAVYRYEKYWLPLAADHPHELLSPPLDIEWAWHCHMLCPKAYEKDCNAIVGTTVDHTMWGASKFYAKQKQSQKYWSAKYGNDQESFTVDYKASDELTTTETYHSKITYDILAAAKRQMDLCYQVSLPHHRDRKYLQNSLLRYKKFLYLKARMPNEFLEPSYDIDLVWHSHQLNPRIYKQDMVRIVGYFLNHGEQVDYRTKEDKLIADKLSRETWKYFYNETMSVPGAMYRGNQPAGILYKTKANEAYMSCTKSTKITFEKVTLSIPHTDKRVILSVSSSADKKGVGNRITLKGEPRHGNGKITWTSVGQLELDTMNASCLFMILQEQAGLAYFGPKTVIGLNAVNILPLIKYTSNTGFDSQIRVSIPLGTKIGLDLHIRLVTPKIGKALLVLGQGRYKPAIIPENVQQCLGPVVTFERLPPGIDNRCEVATHRLKNHIGNVEFAARIIHSQAVVMSVIQVFRHDKMLAIGHLIASDHLPLPTQVHQDEITLNPMQGERAIILKNSGGDWGIITGRWKGFKPEVARYTRGESKTGSPGTLFLKVYKFSTGKTTTVKLGYHRKDYVCSLDSAQIDLMKGVLTIDSSGNEVAENIALAFSVSLLHVLCVPRPNRWMGGQQVISPVTQGYRPITSIPSTDMKFITAAGMLQKTPSNDYIYTYKRSHICIMCVGGCPIEFDAQFLSKSS